VRLVVAIAGRRTARLAGACVATCILGLAGLLGSGCTANTEPKPAELAFAARRSSDIRAELAPTSAVVQQLALGERVEVLARRRSTIRVRTTSGVEGWTHESDVVSAAVRKQMEELAQRQADAPPQGLVRAFDVLNVHLKPARDSTTIYQLQPDEGADLLRREVAPTAPGDKAESWYLVRLETGHVGWLLARRVYSDIPVEVAQYAEGRPIIAYFALGEVVDKSLGVVKTTWLWTQTDRREADYDFDRLRVFRWSAGRDSYQTIKLERRLRGYLPIRVGPVSTEKGEAATGFAVTVEKGGRRFVRTYALAGQRVALLSEQAVEPAPAPEPTEVVPPAESAEPEGFVDRLTSWFRPARQR
jgi:hypothetical protein